MFVLPFVFINAALVAGSALNLIKAFGECGGSNKGTCESGTLCSSGVPSYCFPLDHYTNSSTPINEITGYGRPVASMVDAVNADTIAVWTGCTNSQFSGSCLTFSLSCNFCVKLDAPWRNSLSSISILDTRVGCNYWVADNCAGDGINIDSGAIFDLSATNYNDRIVAFNCYLTGR